MGAGKSAKEKPRLAEHGLDHETARIYCPRAKKEVTFRLEFNDDKLHTKALALLQERTFLNESTIWTEIHKLGGRIRIVPPHEDSLSEETSGNVVGGVAITDPKSAGERFGIPPKELQMAQTVARNAIMNGLLVRNNVKLAA